MYSRVFELEKTYSDMYFHHRLFFKELDNFDFLFTNVKIISIRMLNQVETSKSNYELNEKSNFSMLFSKNHSVDVLSN